MLEPGEAPCLKAQMCISSFHDQNPEFRDEIASVHGKLLLFHGKTCLYNLYMFFMIK